MTKSTTTHSANSKASLQSIDAIRAHVAAALASLNANPTLRYELGFDHSIEEFGRCLSPKGYDRYRSRVELIESLLNSSSGGSRAILQTMEDVYAYFDKSFADGKLDPPDSRYQFGYEDANWRMWSMIDPRGRAAALHDAPD